MALCIETPTRSLIVLIGPPACGKSTFAVRHFPATAVVSSDACRKLVSDSEHNQTASRQAFDVMAAIIAKRMELGRLVVADAMHIHVSYRRRWLDLAGEHDYPAYAIVFDVPEAVCLERDMLRQRRVGADIVRNNVQRMTFDVSDLTEEGFAGGWRVGADAVDVCRVSIVTNRPPGSATA